MNHNKRKEKRLPVTGDFLYGSGGAPDVNGIIVDISESGTCFYSFRGFEPGSFLRIKNRSIGNGSPDAVVKWCNKISQDFYQTGIYFNGKSD